MISPRKLVKLARTWQKVVAKKRKRISFTRINSNGNSPSTSTSTVALAAAGHFVIYTMDDMRFSIPVAYLNSKIITELFRISEEVFGLPVEGPIKIACDAAFMKYVISLIRRGLPKDIEKALLTSMEANYCSLSVAANDQGLSLGQPLLIC